MTTDEIQARLSVLETFTISALAIAMMAHGTDPDKKRSIAALDTIKMGALKRLHETGSDMNLGAFYLDELLSYVSGNLDHLTRE